MSVASAADEIWEILYDLRSPREAAKAIAAAHVRLLEADGARSERDVRVRLAEVSQAALEVWAERANVSLSQ